MRENGGIRMSEQLLREMLEKLGIEVERELGIEIEGDEEE